MDVPLTHLLMWPTPSGRCLCDVVVVRLVAGIAAGVEGSGFGVCGS
jgi:hypothetical protein